MSQRQSRLTAACKDMQRLPVSDLQNGGVVWDAFHFLYQFGAVNNSVDALIFILICNTNSE